MQKSERHQAILDLISAKKIARQEELVKELAGRGLAVTQASVSRDLDELGIIKISGAYAPSERSTKGFGLELIAVEKAGPYMVIVKTGAGLASASTVRIDGAKLPDIVGTIAGDDTIFVAVKDEIRQKSVIKAIYELFERQG